MDGARFQAVAEGVYFPRRGDVRLNVEDVDRLKEEARRARLGRARICTHPRVDAPVHEMIVAQTGQTYIRPHRHLGRSESTFVMEGKFDLVVFNELGKVEEVVPMGDPTSGRSFYYRMDEPRFHTLDIRSDCIVIHEATQGPFRHEDNEVAAWSPMASDAKGIDAWRKALRGMIAGRGWANHETH